MCFVVDICILVIHLFTTYSQFSLRRNEFEFALTKNLNNKHISSVTVFSEGSPKILGAKHILLDRRPAFKDFTDHINANYQDKLVCIANADIFFDNSISLLKNLKQDQAICLTRNSPAIDIENINIEKSLPSTNKDDNLSFDSFFFHSPVSLQNHWFLLGVLGCDNRFAYELYKAGLKISNPAKIINSYHVHKKPNSNNGTWLQGNYLRVNLTDSLEYVKENVSAGWSENGISHYPDDWKWVPTLTNNEYLEREDIPVSVKRFYNRHVNGMKRPKV